MDSVIEGAQYAYDNGATAVSMSFRTYEESQIMHETFIAVWDNGNGLLPIEDSLPSSIILLETKKTRMWDLV